MHSIYIHAMILGSSLIVYAHFLFSVMRIDMKTYSYELYSWLAPLFFGLMNMAIVYRMRTYHTTLRRATWTVMLCAVLTITTMNILLQTYPHHTRALHYIHYGCRMLIMYTIAFGILYTINLHFLHDV